MDGWNGLGKPTTLAKYERWDDFYSQVEEEGCDL